MTAILIGFKNCGKTTVGRVLADQLGWAFVDTDQLLSPSEPIRELYQRLGEQDFRSKEAKVIGNLNPGQSAVIATGGGALSRQQSVVKLQSMGPLIYLQLDRDTLLERAVLDAPAFIRDDFDIIHAERITLYQDVADCIVDIQGCSVDQAAQKIKEVIDGQ